MPTYIPTIGLEIHAHLITKTKMFCACPNTFGDEPNANVCPVCLGMPGQLPVANQEAIIKAITAGLALNCTIPPFTKWDRKHYFYPDLPKGYQISQYDLPLCGKGNITITKEDGSTKNIGITRAHLEEDAGKLVHADNGGYSLVDLNRAGAPLLEIVSEPDMTTAEEAVLYAKDIRHLLTWVGVNTGNLQEGDMRFDVNVSIRPSGQKSLGTKVEIKNLNSFRSLQEAINYEIARQSDLLDSGKTIPQETRLWDTDKGISRSMRSKENADDYRYFPEPDLPPLTPSADMVTTLRKALPPLPHQVRNTLQDTYQLSDLDTHVLTSDKALYDLFSDTLSKAQTHNTLKTKTTPTLAKTIVNWLGGKFLNLLREKELEVPDSHITPDKLIELITLVEDGTISSNTAKTVFETMFATDTTPKAIVEAQGLGQISDTSTIEHQVDTVLSANPDIVNSIKNGKTGAIGFLVGQVMKETKGKANPKLVNEIITKKLALT